MATIKVNSTVMRDKAETFRSVASTIYDLTQEMFQEIEGLHSVWEGESAELTVKQFQSLQSTFEEKKQTIENYAKFLEEAAQAYDEAEEYVQQGAEGTK